jgi:plasmid stabilization system protein ParE
MKLRYERGALADLDEIFAYIAADSREAAGRLVARIERVATRIAASPHIGGTTRKSGFLRFPVGKYLIVYEMRTTRWSFSTSGTVRDRVRGKGSRGVGLSGRLRRRRHGSQNTGMAAGVKPRSREAVRLFPQGFTRDDCPGENEC